MFKISKCFNLRMLLASPFFGHGSMPQLRRHCQEYMYSHRSPLTVFARGNGTMNAWWNGDDHQLTRCVLYRRSLSHYPPNHPTNPPYHTLHAYVWERIWTNDEVREKWVMARWMRDEIAMIIDWHDVYCTERHYPPTHPPRRTIPSMRMSVNIKKVQIPHRR